ncbi:MAG TPA: DUF3471 domain-containing protein [Vicinamibacterales bacterium]|nr:DUF3471 domain-containing protein [Vicinamibacterales bacterium]
MKFRSLVPTLTAMSVVFAVSAPIDAQWINHPTPGIPRTADGKPDLTAPTPRASDGKPDLSGIWAMNGLGYTTNITSVEMLPWAQKVYEARSATYGHEDPAVSCLPEGPRAGLAGLEPFRIVQTPYVSFFLYETSPVRQVFSDGRKPPVDPTPTWMGYSVARWEGDTLIVETSGYNDKTWLDFTGHPHSEALRMTERFRRTDFGHMKVAITFEDPKAYTKPWTIDVDVNLVPDTELLEYVCLENEKDRERLVGRASDDRSAAKKVSRDVLSRYVGIYDVPMLGVWTVSLDGDELKIEMADGGGKQAVISHSDTVFIYPPVGGPVRFISDAQGQVTGLVVTIVEGDIPARKR